MIAEFSDQEKNLLKGLKASIARKYSCSTTYVMQIVNGSREINSPLSMKIYKDLKHQAEFLTPETPEK
jgi:hypothetical protein